MKANATVRLPLLLALGLAVLPARAANETRSPSEARTTQPGNSSQSVSQLNEEGAALYAARDYRRAIEKFIQAYAVDSDPNLLFNIARCYEELGEADAAIEKYENFLKTPGADSRGRQRARESLQALRDNKKESERAAATSSSNSPHRAAEPSTDVALPPRDAGESPVILPWLTLGGSVLFAAAGTTLYVLGASDHGNVTDAQGYGDANAVVDMTRREADDLVSSGNTKKLLGGVSFGVAGALAVTYVVLAVTGSERSSEESSAVLTVTPSLRGGAFSMQGSF
jgi:tetratricopeptide (TPR) repeat protein